MNHNTMRLLVGAALSFTYNITAHGAETLTRLVDTHIGTGGHGHVFVGANVPFGMVQLGPTSVTQGWDWCSGYHESDSTVLGFSHTHLSGTGIGDLYDVTLMPVIGTDLRYDRGNTSLPASGLWSPGDRSREISRPGYYSIPLTRYGINAELTATSRAGFHRYTFPASQDAAIVIDLDNGGNWDSPTDIGFNVVNDRRITGWRHSRGWANNQKVFYAVDFSRPFTSFERHGEEGIYGRANFITAADDTILVKVGISNVSVEGAIANLEAELPGWDFDGTATRAEELWEKELSKIRITTPDENVKRIFYTSLYHTMIAPSEFNDVNGDYRCCDGSIASNAQGGYYTTFSLWDTYRAQMPLLSIFQQERYADMVNTMLAIHDQQGRLPVWHLWGCETNCMVGNPGIPVVADAIVKNVPGIDRDRAYKALVATAMNPGRGNGLRQQYGYIPFDLMENESIAYDMEYALADWAASQAALAMGDSLTHEMLAARSKSYRNYFDRDLGLVRGKDSRGNWREPFNPFDTSHGANDYCEGNAWQYTWLVPHDLEGLTECFGSRERLVSRLDSLFTMESTLAGEDVSPDVSGLIGQYAHGNEPGHHTVYLYTMLGEPAKVARLIRQILETQYTTKPDGLSGNEDVGQMSAWYIMSALGFYEVEPGSGRYWLGSPLLDEAVIKVPGGEFRLTANSPGHHPVLRSAILNGKPLDRLFITHDEIINGGTLEFVME